MTYHEKGFLIGAAKGAEENPETEAEVFD